MRTLVTALSIVLFISSCGGAQDNGKNTSSSSTSSSSSSSSSTSGGLSSSSSSSSSNSSSSSSSSSSNSSSGGFIGNAVQGSDLYKQQCQNCHGTRGIKTANGGDATAALNANNFTEHTLFNKIQRSMPPLPNHDPNDCIDQCAADVAAYIRTWISEVALSCDTSRPINYSPRTLRVLTVDEYKASLVDLLGLPEDFPHNIVSDNYKGGFPNNGTANIDQNSTNKYWLNAWEVAAWAVANNKPDGCGEKDCSTVIVDEFLPRLFRRPLTETEINTYYDIFSAHTEDEAHEMAMATALSSPQFLYRSEMGLRIKDVLDGVGFEPRLEAVNAVTVSAADLGSSNLVDGYRRIPLYGSINRSITEYTFTGNDIVKIKIKGEPADGSWPTMLLKIGGQDIAQQEINSPGGRILRFHIEGQTGTKHFQIENKNFGAHSQRRYLYVGDIVFGEAQYVEPPKPDTDKLRNADEDAFVLDAYEYATLISFLTTGSTPDDNLLEAAEAGELESSANVRAHINRLLDTQRGKNRVGDIAAYWFGTDAITEPGADRNNVLFPSYTTEVRHAMAEEVRRLFQSIFYDTSGTRTFTDFYRGDFTVVNSTLADYYDINANTNSPEQWVIVDNLEKRGGMLTTGAFMSLHAHPEESAPILRATHLRRDVLCQQIEDPPLLEADREKQLAIARELDEQGTLTTAGFYNIITDSPACDGCHKEILNPLFGMEDFGPTGLWRDSEKGSTGMNLPIDARGLLYGPNDVNDLSESIAFTGAKELSKIVATLPGARACLVDKTFRYITGMPINANAIDKTTEDSLTANQSIDFACAEDRALAKFQIENHSPRAVFVEIMMQDLLRYRTAKN